MTEDQLIARMYHASSGLATWPTVLIEIAESLDSTGAHIIGINKSSGQLALSLHTSNPPADGIGDLTRESQASGSCWTPGTGLPLCQVINNRGNNGHELTEIPFFREFLKPYRYRHIIGGKVCDDDDLIAVLGVCRGADQRAYSIHEERRLGRLLTHFSKSLDLMRELREWRAHSDVGEALLGRSQRPSFLVGPGARILFANDAGRNALKQASVVINRQGVLLARDSGSDAKLKCAMCTLGMLGSDAQNKCPDRIPLWLSDIRRGHHVPACLWAIRANKSLRVSGTDPMGMLILTSSDPPSRAIPDPFVLTSMFGFTAAEARIAAHLIAGATPKQIAAVLNLQMPTVRFHIRQLLAKCECHDQRQLIRRLSEALEVNGL